MNTTGNGLLEKPSENSPIATKNFTQKWFWLGAVGIFIFMSGTTLYWILGITMQLFWYLLISYLGTIMVLGSIFSLLIGIGGTLGAFTFLGYYWNFEDTLGLAVCITTLIFTWWLPIMDLLENMGLLILPHTFEWVIFHNVFLVSVVFLGVQMVLWGVSMIKARFFVERRMTCITAGILFIIAGAFTTSIIGIPVGFIMTLPAGSLGIISILFLRTE